MVNYMAIQAYVILVFIFVVAIVGWLYFKIEDKKEKKHADFGD